MSENELLEKHALTAAQMKIMGVIWNMQPDTCTPTEIWRQVNEQEQNNYNRTTVSPFCASWCKKDIWKNGLRAEGVFYIQQRLIKNHIQKNRLKNYVSGMTRISNPKKCLK